MRHEAQLAQREAELRHHEDDLGRWQENLRQQEAHLAQREHEHEAELCQQETELCQQEEELRQRQDGQQAVTVGADGAPNQASSSYRHAQQLRAVPKPAVVNGAPRLEEVRTVASVHGRHDMERMAIRAVTDTLGNTDTETVHERTRTSPLDSGAPAAPSEQSTELEQLRQENAELARSLRVLKSAAAALAAALDLP